jgi:uncharacterized repeat protein (TIGR03837 family)
VFCRVIDNFGDIGVCWRLCADLAARGHQVRLWVDDPSPLEWMAPGALDGNCPGVRVLLWSESLDPGVVRSLARADAWIEGFGCEIAPEFIATSLANTLADGQNQPNNPVWINLEYLSAEDYVARCHALPSPVMQGPAKGCTKYFYYPGFTPATGGLLREPGLLQTSTQWNTADQRGWLERHGIAWQGERIVSLFCYEPAGLTDALVHWMRGPDRTLLLVAPGRAARAVEVAWPRALQRAGLREDEIALRTHLLPTLTQVEFDALLRSCDVNLVRGEDSLVRALWAGRPFVWNIYPQDDGAHIDKLQAFLSTMRAPATLCGVFAVWNGVELPAQTTAPPVEWDALYRPETQAVVRAWRQALGHQVDLVTGLVEFARKRR